MSSSNATDWTNATYDTTAQYNLTVEIVNQYLRELFGNWDFFTELVPGDTIKFWVPRSLSDAEKKVLKARGY
ncbi:hypothetical protein VTL71DRAFT_7771 [Oculimacula yallundae]|uniref:Uncharacterized protein n=1 Tax=Oculimacula yallundae TaxID=86028 RepID=A0ABR4CW30_9HELO